MFMQVMQSLGPVNQNGVAKANYLMINGPKYDKSQTFCYLRDPVQ